MELIVGTSLLAAFVAGIAALLAPLRWDGPPPGGHHWNGTLTFPQIVPRPNAIKIIVRDVGGIATRTFDWILN